MRIVLHNAELGRLHFAFSTAAAACAFDRQVLIFVTGDAVASPVFREDHARDAALAGFSEHAEARGVATPRELLEIIRDFGARIWVCEAALKLADMSLADIDPSLSPEPGGIAGLLHENGEMIII